MAKTIMTADDSASVRQMIHFTLKQAGYDVVEAKDGVEALAKLNAAPVNMLITDLNMPNMDGITLIQNIRASADLKFLPVVMVTTESMDEKKQEGRSAGASAWIVKPFRPPQLLGVVQKLLG